MRSLRSERALTLLEMVLTMVLVGIGILLFSLILFQSWAHYETELARIQLQQELDAALAVVEEDIMEGETVSVTNNGADLTVIYPAGPNPPFAFSQILYQIQANGDLLRTTTDPAGNASAQVLIQGFVNPGQSGFFTDAIPNLFVCQLTLVSNVNAMGQPVTLSGSKRVAKRNM